ncbi:MAG: pseudaminic acid synthase [Gemmatimonadaceae bacterium]|uniref:pseudaminic acid synthase n=1 Tax=Gemmatimonas sp. UBA7669 TaxID=1946568 RepID=UPI0025BAF077|nr:pseudaminic acid synthase [Gemmatimonas sp. UBA7669]MBA3917171.1 pseudaminic acid synthase [Gemmatimonas sp.]MBX9857448.1 pseudaminic acid synthase [Gemmatimonadaceae bacterium]
MILAGRSIGPDNSPYIIAEMSGNHNQSLDRALAIVDAAAAAGAHAIKLQTYTADTMTLDLAAGEFTIRDPNSLWVGRSLHDLYQEAHTPWDWHAPIMARAKAKGLACFSSPFDESAVDFLETLDAPAYKIASFECIDLPLIRRAASTGKPLIISTGMATVSEVAEAVDTARAAGCTELALLRCTSTYPASPEHSHLRSIPHLRALFGCEVGLSDHTLGIGVAVASVACGATVIEKHFTLARADGGVDAVFSLEPSELQQLVVETERAWQALGQVHYGPTPAEVGARSRRRSLYVAADLVAGSILTPENLRRVRPGLGLAPRYYDQVLGRRVNRDVAKGTPLQWDLLD